MAIDISSAVSLIGALSVASERLVEIIKGSPLFTFLRLNEKADPDSKAERWRQVKIHLLSLTCGIVTAYVARESITNAFPGGHGEVLTAGILASGGSSFWNSITGFMASLKK